MKKFLTLILEKFSSQLTKYLGIKFAAISKSNWGLFLITTIASAVTIFQQDLISATGDWGTIINLILVIISGATVTIKK